MVAPTTKVQPPIYDEDTHPMKKQAFHVIRTLSTFFATSAVDTERLNFFRIFKRAVNLVDKWSDIIRADEITDMPAYHLLRCVTEQALGRRSFVQNPSFSV
jgi:hypothetical protein